MPGCHHGSLGTSLSVGNERDREKERESTRVNKSRVISTSLGTRKGGQRPSSCLGYHHPRYLPGPSPGSQMLDSPGTRCPFSKRWWQGGRKCAKEGPAHSTWRSWACLGVPYLAGTLRIRVLFPTSPISSAPALQGEVRTMNGSRRVLSVSGGTWSLWCERPSQFQFSWLQRCLGNFGAS